MNPFESTLVPTEEGEIYTANEAGTELILVGKVLPEYVNLLANAGRLHTIMVQAIKCNEALLTILEAEGLDRAAGNLMQTTAMMKLIEKCSFDGPNVLTGFNPTSN